MRACLVIRHRHLYCSFSARDCIMPVLARYLRKEHSVISLKRKSLFTTLRTFDSFCSSYCSHFVTLNSSILLAGVTAYGLNHLGLDNNMWPLFNNVTEMHKNPGRLKCANRWFSRYVIAAMLVDENKRFLISFFCFSTSNCTLQHCYLYP